MDHGIEDPQSRKLLGKPETGMIKLSASYSGNVILIMIEDDGNGIDLNKIKQKAIEKGILQLNSNPGKQELLDIIFLPGFSTAQSLSEVSGRGVGMDIVKKRITELHGSVTIESELGHGTKFIIKLNQSMSITDTLLFQVEDSYFIVPISEIEKVDVIKSYYILGEMKYGGVIQLFTKKNNFGSLLKKNKMNYFELIGISKDNRYAEVNYSDNTLIRNKIPDFRNTLYWNPLIVTNEQGEANISFYTSDEKGKFLITIEGISVDGVQVCKQLILETE